MEGFMAKKLWAKALEEAIEPTFPRECRACEFALWMGRRGCLAFEAAARCVESALGGLVFGVGRDAASNVRACARGVDAS